MQFRKIADIDEYLGDASSRFFGDGYKKVNYRITNKILNNEEVAAKLTIDFPEDWSVKRKKDKLKPHLSSIDVLIIASNLCGLVLTRQIGDISKCYINSISVMAGKTALLNLDDVFSNVKLTYKNICNDIEMFNFKGKIGNMQIYIEVYRNKLDDTKVTDYLLLNNYIKNGFKKAKHGIKNIIIKESNYSAKANFIKINPSVEYNSVDIIDAFVSSLQLGQILLYELDNIKRAVSNNLWMRSIKITKKNIRLNNSNNITTILDDMHISEIKKERWRSANIVSKLRDIKVVCSVAHQLPDGGQNNGG